MSKIAIFKKSENRIVYVVGVSVCYKYAKITSILELETNDHDFIRLDQLNDYIIGTDEMVELFMLIDKRYEELHKAYFELKGDSNA